jgi:hypothetical protein
MTETTFDFRDGYGPVAAHKHPNGGGWVADTATVPDEVAVPGSASIGEGASIGEWASIGYGASIGEGASIGRRASIGYGASIGRRASIGEWASIGYGASIGRRASIGPRASIGEGASIGEADWWITVGPQGSRNAMLTAVWSKERGLRWWVGCQYGIGTEELRASVEKTHGGNIAHWEDYAHIIECVEKHPGLERAKKAAKVGE